MRLRTFIIVAAALLSITSCKCNKNVPELEKIKNGLTEELAKRDQVAAQVADLRRILLDTEDAQSAREAGKDKPIPNYPESLFEPVSFPPVSQPVLPEPARFESDTAKKLRGEIQSLYEQIQAKDKEVAEVNAMRPKVKAFVDQVRATPVKGAATDAGVMMTPDAGAAAH